MAKAVYADKKTILSFLAVPFTDNKSVNYIIKQDVKKFHGIKRLI